MRAPAFWNIKHGRDAAFALRTILWPLSVLFDYFTQNRIKTAKPLRLAIPVISIGNLTLGGTGKTPLAQSLRRKLAEKYGKVAIVSRGYKGKLQWPVKVDIASHSAGDVGDEPLMLAQSGDVYIGKSRAEAAQLAVANGAKAIILDDGHQNPSLAKDLSIVVVDGEVGFGNGMICPSGPLREQPETGLKRADIVVWIGDKSDAQTELSGFADKVYFANIIAQEHQYEGKYLAFCGIGRPEKFEGTLRDLSVDLVDLFPFPDHHDFSESEIAELRSRAASEGAKLITTEKDISRLNQSQKTGIEVVKIEIMFENPNDLGDIIELLIAKYAEVG
ncbi:MAG: tetraacyldisaccharide 4'-kinase [Pseudomonadota bacterium]